MSIIQYIRDKSVFLTINFIIYLAVLMIFISLGIEPYIVALVFIIWFTPLILYILIEFYKQKKYYDEINDICDNLDKKYLLSEVINEPDFEEGKALYYILKDTNRSMREEINEYKKIQEEYEEYIELWVHEIKTPIASTLLFIENNEEIISLNIKNEIKSIENYVEQALYYSKANDVNKDYIVKKFKLELVVRNVIRRNASFCINKKIIINLEELNKEVYSDFKWAEFIINQVISNSIKYSRQISPEINISSVKNKNNTVLIIEDNGVGIIEKDINKVFDKGFTGENGRQYGKSTGIGLYICKKLCDKLGLSISLTSQENKGTTVNIVFPYDKNRAILE